MKTNIYICLKCDALRLANADFGSHWLPAICTKQNRLMPNVGVIYENNSAYLNYVDFIRPPDCPFELEHVMSDGDKTDGKPE